MSMLSKSIFPLLFLSLLTFSLMGYNRSDTIQLFETYKSKADTLFEKDHIKESLHYYTLCHEIVQRNNLTIEYQSILYDIAFAHYYLNEYAKSIKYFNEYLLTNDNIKLKVKANIFNKMSQASRFMGDIEQSYSYQLHHLELSEQIGDKKGISRANYEIGSIFFYQENYQNALSYYRKSYEQNLLLKDSFTIFSSLSAIGSTYNRLGNIDSAYYFNTTALQLAQNLEYQTGIAYAYQNLASDYIIEEKFDEAINLCHQSIALKEKRNDKWGICGSLRSLGEIYIQRGDYTKAQEFLSDASDIANEIQSKPRQAEIYQLCAKLYKKMNQFEKSNSYLEKYIEIKEEIVNKNAIMAIESSRIHYEVSKRDKEILNLKKDTKINRLKYRTVLYIIGMLLLFTLLLAFSYKKLRNTIKILGQKNELINKQNIALENSNKELEQFAYVASHDMREPIRTIRSFSGLLKKRYDASLGQKGNEFISFIEDASERMDAMLTDLLDYSRVNTQNKDKKIIDLSDPLNKAILNLKTLIQSENVNIQSDDLPEVTANGIQMERLFQNLISNAIKYNDKENKEINISFIKNGQSYIFDVKDNGIGIDPQYQEKVFEIFRRLHTMKEYEGSGIGLSTCKKIIEQHLGKIWIESEKGKGTSIKFTIPFNEN